MLAVMFTYPEDPVLLHTPNKGLFSAKLSVFREPEEEKNIKCKTNDNRKDLESYLKKDEGFLVWPNIIPFIDTNYIHSILDQLRFLQKLLTGFRFSRKYTLLQTSNKKKQS